MNKNVPSAPEYYPEVLLRKLVIEKTFVNLQDHYLPDRKGLQMKGAKVSFSLSFVVPDYTSDGDVEYSYMLEGYDRDWGAFSSVNEASYLVYLRAIISLKCVIRKMCLLPNTKRLLFPFIFFLLGIGRFMHILFIC